LINSDVKQQLPPGIMQRFESAGVVREVTAARKPATQPIGAGLGGQSEAERAEVEKKVQQEAHSVLQTMQDSAAATQEPGWGGLGLRKRVATTIADIAEDSAGVYDAEAGNETEGFRRDGGVADNQASITVIGGQLFREIREAFGISSSGEHDRLRLMTARTRLGSHTTALCCSLPGVAGRAAGDRRAADGRPARHVLHGLGGQVRQPVLLVT